MNEFLDRNWPLVIIAVLLLIALGMANWIPQLNLPGKGLEFRLVDSLPLKGAEGMKGPQVSLLVDGKEVKGAHVSTMIIRNSGNTAIAKEDFEEPLQIHIKNNAEIVQLQFELRPKYINTELSFKGSTAFLSPALLNPGDVIIMQLVTEGDAPLFDVDARVEGVRKLFTQDIFYNIFWGEIGWMHFLAFAFSLFNLLLLGLSLKTDGGARYVVLHKHAGIAVFISMSAVSLYIYFSLMADHSQTVYASRLLLLAVSMLALLSAWQTLRLTDKE